jgi:outer membrane protein
VVTTRPENYTRYGNYGVLLAGLLSLAPLSPALAGPDASPGTLSDLTLQDAVRLALENNLGAKVERVNTAITEERVIQAAAGFEPVLSLSARYESNEKPQNTREFVATSNSEAPREDRIFVEDNWLFSTSVKGKSPIGTEYEFVVELNELRNTLNINSPPSQFYPEYESFAGLRLTQPLLRDFGTGVQLAGLRVARREKNLAELGWKLKVEQTVAGVMKSYYDLVFAHQDAAIKADNIQRAKQLETENKKRLEQGVGNQLDVQQAAVAASVREEELIVAQYQALEKRSLLLRELVSDLDPTAIPEIRPDHRLKGEAPGLDRAALMEAAFANRLEYQSAKLQLEKQEIVIKFAKNQVWPRLDLVGSLGANGLDSGGGSAVEDALDGSTPAWSAGVMVTVPLGNRAARSKLRETMREKEQLLLNFKQLEIDLALQVEMAAARVETSGRRLSTARASLGASQTTLDAELKRLSEGVGVSFNVLEAQKDVASAGTRELAARADLNKALVDLWLSTGTLLEREGISLDETAPIAAK